MLQARLVGGLERGGVTVVWGLGCRLKRPETGTQELTSEKQRSGPHHTLPLLELANVL